VVSWVGRGMGVLDGGGDRRNGRGSFGGKGEATTPQSPLVTKGTLWRSCSLP